MPKILRNIIVAIVLILVVGFGYLLLWENSDISNDTAAPNQQNTTPAMSEPEQLQEGGRYVDYSAEAVTSTQNQRILFFHAPWCPQCRLLDASIKGGLIPTNVTIFKVDYDSNQKLRQQYGVTIQTTLVLLDSNGNEAKKYVAYDQPSLDAIIMNLL
jgi:thiol-disulfide isomerase/thioredoxin